VLKKTVTFHIERFSSFFFLFAEPNRTSLGSMRLSKLICVIWVFQVCFFFIFFYFIYYYFYLFFILFDFEKMTLTVVPLNSGN